MPEEHDQIMARLDAIIGLLSHRIVMGEAGDKRKDAEKQVVRILKSAKIPSKQIGLALGKTVSAVDTMASRAK